MPQHSPLNLVLFSKLYVRITFVPQVPSQPEHENATVQNRTVQAADGLLDGLFPPKVNPEEASPILGPLQLWHGQRDLSWPFPLLPTHGAWVLGPGRGCEIRAALGRGRASRPGPDRQDSTKGEHAPLPAPKQFPRAPKRRACSCSLLPFRRVPIPA